MADFLPSGLTLQLNLKTEVKATKTYKIDFDAGRIIGETDNLDALLQHIAKMLMTERFRCLIYNHEIGIETEPLQNSNHSEDLVKAFLKDSIEDALLWDSRILGLANFEFTFKGRDVYVTFLAETIYGNAQYEQMFELL